MSQFYDKFDLLHEDSYDDEDYASYETMDYDSTDAEAIDPAKEDAKTTKPVRDLNDDPFEFYHTTETVLRGKESRDLFTRLAKQATGDPVEKKEAFELACRKMKGMIRQNINQKYRTYIERDPAYREDLEQECYRAVIEELPRYDSSKGDPSTFFYWPIKSALSHYISADTKRKHADAMLCRKLERIRKRYKEEYKREPTLSDYAVETGETLSQLRNITRIMNMDTNTHLEAIEQYDELLKGNEENNSAYRNPEDIVCKKIQINDIIRRMHELFSDDECKIFVLSTVNNESISSLAAKFGYNGREDYVRRIIDNIKHTLRYDPAIRSLNGQTTIPSMNIVQFIPLSGTNESMDILAAVQDL